MTNSSNSLEFIVKNARSGSDAQKKAGIMATFSLRVMVGGECVCEASDLMIRKGSKGTFIASPSREYKSKDGETRYISYFRLWPDEKDNKSSTDIIEMVKRECENPTPKKYPPKTTPTPVKDSW